MYAEIVRAHCKLIFFNIFKINQVPAGFLIDLFWQTLKAQQSYVCSELILANKYLLFDTKTAEVTK